MPTIEVDSIEFLNRNYQISMIKYSLICRNCDLNFESWFASSKEYEKLKVKFLNCHKCNSIKVENLMAPSLIRKLIPRKIKLKRNMIRLKLLVNIKNLLKII